MVSGHAEIFGKPMQHALLTFVVSLLQVWAKKDRKAVECRKKLERYHLYQVQDCKLTSQT